MELKRDVKVAVLLSFVVLVGCERPAEDEAVPADTAADVGAAPAPSPEPTTVELDEVGNSGISGEATATHGPNEVTISIVLKEGAQAATNYPAHIHTGTCEKGGPVAVDLGAVSNLQASKTVALSALPTNQDAFVQVHDAAGKAVACGDMKGHDAGAGRDTAHSTTRH